MCPCTMLGHAGLINIPLLMSAFQLHLCIAAVVIGLES
jgi:hypothetical protein